MGAANSNHVLDASPDDDNLVDDARVNPDEDEVTFDEASEDGSSQSQDEDAENGPSPSQDGADETVGYKFYKWPAVRNLGLFSALCLMQAWAWNTPGPIVTPLEIAYGWKDAIVAYNVSAGCFFNGLGSVVLLFRIKTGFDMRTLVLFSTAILCFGTLVRFVSLFFDDPVYFLYASYCCSICSGVAGVVVSAAPSEISDTWFPPKWRISATAFSIVANQLGNGVSSLVGPWLVPDNFPSNGTHGTNGTIPTQTIAETKIWMTQYMGYVFGLMTVLLFSVWLFFQSKPPTPPSASNKASKHSFSLSSLFDRGLFRRIGPVAFANAVTGGCGLAWGAVLTMNIRPLGIDDERAGVLGTFIVIICCVAAMVVPVLDSSFGWSRHRKVMIFILNSVACVFFTLFTLIVAGIIPYRGIGWLYATAVPGAAFAFGSAPFFYEYAVDNAFPVSPTAICAILTITLNLVACLFYAVFFFHWQTYNWMNYFLAGSFVLACVVMLFSKDFKERQQADNEEEDAEGLVENEEPAEV